MSLWCGVLLDRYLKIGVEENVGTPSATTFPCVVLKGVFPFYSC